MPFAAAGMRGPMFSYAGPVGAGTGYVHDGPYAVVDVQTTGLRPGRGDRVVEIAVARVDSGGRIEDEFATLVNPGRDTGPEFLHGIGNADVQRAPTFDQVVPELLQRLDGAVLVAHNAPFEEAFLHHELRRAGVSDLQLPALCTLWLGRQTFETPNYKLGTLARHANVPLPDKHVALGHARTVSALLPTMLGRYGRPLGYGCDPHQHSVVTPATPARLVTRAVALRKGADGYMSSLLTRLPMTANEADGTFVEVYLEALSEVLADGKIVADEAKQLAQLAGAAGLGRTQIAALNERFLESMREVALADGVLKAMELRQFKAAAKALGVSDYFDDLVVTAGSPAKAAAVEGARADSAPRDTKSQRVRRCGHCRQAGHYRSTCPELA